MQDLDWDDLRYFLAVSRLGSLSAAARQLQVNHSTVLRRLTSLEGRLGVRLFDRNASGYVMTTAAEQLRDRLDDVAELIDAAQRQLNGLDREIAGVVRVTTTDTLARGLLMPCFAEFRALHPGIQLQITINNAFSSLTKREADVAIRPTNAPPQHLVGRNAGSVQTAIYASKAYLKNQQANSDWSEHIWVAPDEGLAHLRQAQWIDRTIPAVRIAVRVDSLTAMVDAVKCGMGAGMLLCMLADAEKTLVRLAEPFAELDTQVWILTHPDLRNTARITAFTSFVYEWLVSHDHVKQANGRGKG